jgi:GrpB-like predicted nucleotidyltransferase (UPF0157 family)
MKTVRFKKTEDIAHEVEAAFVLEEQKLSEVLPHAQIENIAATSVRDSITKGDLDINVRVTPEDFQSAIEVLEVLYEVNQPDNWTAGFASFKDDLRDLGVQLTVIGSPDDYFVAQRDVLRKHPEKVAELNALKEQFEGGNMEEYRKEKGRFFESLDLSSNPS